MVINCRVRTGLCTRQASAYRVFPGTRAPLGPTTASMKALDHANVHLLILCPDEERAVNKQRWRTYSGYPDLGEVWSSPKIPLSTNLLSYPDLREFISQVGDSAKNAIFHHYMRGARVESRLGWNSTPLRVMNAWLQTSPYSAEESSSRNTRSLHKMERRVEPSLREGLGKHGKMSYVFFWSWPICPLLTVLLF